MIATAFAGNPSLVNYDMFVAVFSLLSLVVLFAGAYNEAFFGHPIVPVALDLLNTLFFFCAAIAMAAELGAHSCSNSVSLPTRY
jgi:Membrane-associating domain